MNKDDGVREEFVVRPGPKARLVAMRSRLLIYLSGDIEGRGRGEETSMLGNFFNF